jgi:hypothetical protein
MDQRAFLQPQARYLQVRRVFKQFFSVNVIQRLSWEPPRISQSSATTSIRGNQATNGNSYAYVNSIARKTIAVQSFKTTSAATTTTSSC